ncbi:MAG: hypothetical protein B7Y08_24500 [Rhodospirillales bacterium 24-66-33]|jgi:hypothetical protein|nr:MAG: hypothetical protein B7Y57_24275 [Rhodospirillales bacterium 35-66-84]OYZ91659.1 MAG: hypothetical protein B7Y08_24500 [Rhodospirillales bacterium 24-66-33]OZB22706.1 MAG: hypothetical protein B7X63_21650 [Rhodospirillales bacterium 39-66-50]
MKDARKLIAQLRTRLSQDRLTEAGFTRALAEVLAATSERLSGADSLLLSHEIRELEQEWRNSIQRPVN